MAAVFFLTGLAWLGFENLIHHENLSRHENLSHHENFS
jgi:hypothetical protein